MPCRNRFCTYRGAGHVALLGACRASFYRQGSLEGGHGAGAATLHLQARAFTIWDTPNGRVREGTTEPATWHTHSQETDSGRRLTQPGD